MSNRRHGEGFILVGVVMFVLALTILVLSLFTLSSYEAHSLSQSHARQQAYYHAQSGIEIVKALIMTPPGYSLTKASDAKGKIGDGMLVDAVAMQRRKDGAGWKWDSTGVVTGDSTVLIRVSSLNHGEPCMLEAMFTPSTGRDYFKRLFTVANTVTVANSASRWASNIRLSGMCWQRVAAPSDMAWAELPSWVTPTPHFEFTDPLNLPDLAVYFASHQISDTTKLLVNPNDINRRTLEFRGPLSGPAAYYTSLPQPGSYYSFENTKSVDITVEGTVVWILPAGAHFQQQVTIARKAQSVQKAVLVIVARQSTSSDIALHFKGGLNVTDDVHVIMVTDARAIIEFENESDTYPCRVSQLSILCRDLFLESPGKVMFLELSHGSSLDAVIDDLYADPSGPLPRPPGSVSSLALVRGSWRRATP